MDTISKQIHLSGRLPYAWVGIERVIYDDRKRFLMIGNDFPPSAYPLNAYWPPYRLPIGLPIGCLFGPGPTHSLLRLSGFRVPREGHPHWLPYTQCQLGPIGPMRDMM